MKSRIFMVMAILVLTSLLLGACNMPISTPAFIVPASIPSLRAQAPVANNVVRVFGSPIAAPPGVPRTIQVFVDSIQAVPGGGGRAEATGVANVNISYGGNPIGTVALDPRLPNAQGSIQWTPPAAPGDYIVQADTGGHGTPNERYSLLEATFCVDNLGITIGNLIMPGDTVCAGLPSPETTAPFHITRADATARMGCNTTILEFDITVDHPSNPLYAAFADLSVVSWLGFHTLETSGPGPSLYSAVANSWRTADLLDQLAGTNTITWTAGAIAPSGQVILDGPHQLTITPPDCLVFPTLSAPLIPRIPNLIPYLPPAQPLNAVQTDTPTPTATTCAPGTYYDAASNRCATLAPNTPIPTKKPPACKKYSDEASCGAASCHWNSKTNTCSEP